MKFFIATACIVALVLAEPPPSNSYLPPPPGRNGYSQGQNFGASPEVVAGRGLDVSHGSRGGQARGVGAFNRDYHDNDLHLKGFARNTPRGYGTPQSRFGSQNYDHNAASFGRNVFDEANSEPANYNFGYMVNDHEGADFGHHEERQEERAQGEYHVVLPDGKKQTVNYQADERGFQPKISYQDTDAAYSGYDSNAQSFRENGGSYHGNARSGGY